MSISPARVASFDTLLRIERERAFSSVLLPIYEERLSAVDRSLCHELVLGTLRHHLTFDRIVDALANGRKLDVEVRVALRLGLYQLLSLSKVPARAAINESVELVKRAKKSSASGFVNAILRRASGETIDLNYRDEIDRISVETSHPRWLLERWAASLGIDDAAKLATANNGPARIAFRLGEIDPEVQRVIDSAGSSEHVTGCFLLDRSNDSLRKLAAENKIYLQDEASQMVAHSVAVPVGGSFLDVCAAPGGKTGLVTLLSSSRLSAAGDLYGPRVELLRDNVRRQGVNVNIMRYDATALPFAESTFDAVLVDAPCSGTGTIRHNPEIRYLLTPSDIEELSFKQRRILAEASKAVKKGALLVYSTCSLEQEEGEVVAREFLAENADFQIERPRVPERFITTDDFARTWPHRDGMDGFFIAAFRRG